MCVSARVLLVSGVHGQSYREFEVVGVVIVGSGLFFVGARGHRGMERQEAGHQIS